MKIQYANAPCFAVTAASGYLPGTIASDGTQQGIQRPNGSWLSVQPDGSYQERDTIGPWETVVVDPSVNVLRFPQCVVPFAVAYIGA